LLAEESLMNLYNEIAKLLDVAIVEQNKYDALNDIEWGILDEVLIGLDHALEYARKLEDS
jgi:hypothetical protein